MADQLVIRAYDAELGDCIHVCIPNAKKTDNGNEDFNILIDCGTRGKMDFMKAAVKQLESFLPKTGQDDRRLLDLIVVSHEHQDHIKGFDPAYFENIDIGNIWLSDAMNPDHPQAEGVNSLHSFAEKAMKSMAAKGLSLHPDLEHLMTMYSISNDEAMTALRTTWPEEHDFDTQYIHAGLTGEDLGLDLEDTVIKILGPEENIDYYYLGEEVPEELNGFTKLAGIFEPLGGYNGDEPENISADDFRRLRSRMLSNGFAFAELASKIKNNTSVILMIEWRGKRLLFVGDLEWEEKFKDGIQNGGWNVAWKKSQAELDTPVDFLKIGHHGSTNATPWDEGEEEVDTEPAAILDSILPKAEGDNEPTAKVVVSTNRKSYKQIPESALLVEIAKRVANTKNYKDELIAAGVQLEELKRYDEYEKKWIGTPQPWRTDFEELIEKKGYVKVVIKAD